MKKGGHPAGTARWLCLASSGSLSVLGMDKNALMARAGIHARDLRILDPQLSYPSIILGRERAIVLNLEYLKAIITAEEVFLRNPYNENVRRFAEELRRRILAPEAQLQQQPQHQEHPKPGQDHARRQSAGQSQAATERAQPGGEPQADGAPPSSHPVTIFHAAPTGAHTTGRPLPCAPHNGSPAGVGPLGQGEVSRGVGGATAVATSGHAAVPQPGRGLLPTEIAATGAAPVHIIPSLQADVAGHAYTGRHIGPGAGSMGSHAGLRAAASAFTKASAEVPGMGEHATSDGSGHALTPESDAAAPLLVGTHTQSAEEMHREGASQGEDREYKRGEEAHAGLGSGDGHGAGSQEDRASGRKRELGAGTGLSCAVNGAGAGGTEGRGMAGQGGSGLGVSGEGQLYGDGTGEGGAGAAAPPPFEFQALEVALESACKLLERQAGEFKTEAHEALDKLTSQVTSATLDGVRSMKNEMNQLISRVQKVREELELLLANDRDMAEMYLTDKLVLAAQQQQQQQQQAPGALATAGSMSARGRRSMTPEAAADSHALDPSLSGNSSLTWNGNATASSSVNGYGSVSARGAAGAGGSSAMGHTGLAADSFATASGGTANGGFTGGLGSVAHKASPEGVHRALESVGEGDEGEEGGAWAFPSLLAVAQTPIEHQEPGAVPGDIQEGVLFGTQGVDPQILELRQPSRSPSSSSSSTSSSSSSSSSSSRSRGKKWDVEVLENLLEAYSSEMDKTLNELSSLREYVDDTEDYLNIMLDERQNSLLLMNILIQATTLSITTFLVITTIFAMNIPNADNVAGTMYDGDIPGNYAYFKLMVGFGTAGTLVVFVAIIAYMWRRGLIDGSM